MIQNWNGQQKDFTNSEAIELPAGGKDPIERICIAYGFTSRQALCRHLNVSQSTMANRVARGNFPSDWVLICSMETGASLEWLVYGQGNEPDHAEAPIKDVPHANSTQLSYMEIHNGIMKNQKRLSVPTELIPDNAVSPMLVCTEGLIWLTDDFHGEIVDGFWLIEMDGVTSIRELYRLPGGRIKVENGKHSFECKAEDVKALGKAIARIERI